MGTEEAVALEWEAGGAAGPPIAGPRVQYSPIESNRVKFLVFLGISVARILLLAFCGTNLIQGRISGLPKGSPAVGG